MKRLQTLSWLAGATGLIWLWIVMDQAALRKLTKSEMLLTPGDSTVSFFCWNPRDMYSRDSEVKSSSSCALQFSNSIGVSGTLLEMWQSQNIFVPIGRVCSSNSSSSSSGRTWHCYKANHKLNLDLTSLFWKSSTGWKLIQGLDRLSYDLPQEICRWRRNHRSWGHF